LLQCAQWLVTSLVTALVLVAAAIDILRLLRLLVRAITLLGNAAKSYSQRMPEGGGLGHVRIRHAEGVGGRTCGAGLAIGWRELRRRRRRRRRI
jgi:hypothetical protein